MSDDPAGTAGEHAGPRPIPELGMPDSFAPVGPPEAATAPPPAAGPVVSGPATPRGPVTDDDRQSYRRLLDSAFERGLLGPYDYEVRLRELSEATTIEAMKQIVTEMPVFALPDRNGKAMRSPLAAPPGPGGVRRSNPWTKLIILVVVVVVLAFVILAVFAEHLVHDRRNGSSPPVVPAAVVKSPRP
ncbi:MAG: hypothetical protein ACLQOZ_02290 [Acidimicrobiales bacterium]